MTYNASLIVAIAQARSEPWESIWLNGQVPTWVSRFKNEVEIVTHPAYAWEIFGKDSIHFTREIDTPRGLVYGRGDLIIFSSPGLLETSPPARS